MKMLKSRLRFFVADFLTTGNGRAGFWGLKRVGGAAIEGPTARRLEVGITVGEATKADAVEGETEDVPADRTAAASERVNGLKGSGLGLPSVPPLVTESGIGFAITGEYSKVGKENILTATVKL